MHAKYIKINDVDIIIKKQIKIQFKFAFIIKYRKFMIKFKIINFVIIIEIQEKSD